MRGRASLASVGVVAVLSLSACTVEAGASDDVIRTGELEKQVDRSLTEKVGESPKKVDCPDPLRAKKGAHTRCTLSTYDGLRFGVTVTAGRTGDDGRAHVDIEVDQEPQ
ncbi:MULTISPECIES: DUF4333 domain-containing protein [Streptomyces]|uniref:DUF4333 domain-containing protein n=1 Tax=Streptomyces TaxID=1883 RepID=UPI00099BCC51|nr:MULTISPECIES: DUF4333 domain-containing protein [Streptomyces]